MSGEEFSVAELRQFRRFLLSWYDLHARDLPWRRSTDPYAIWVSEIMLQQTRVNAVLDHYARFLDRFPTVQSLAEAAEPDVLAIWSGLGYYRRARMLHRAAQTVVREWNGSIPKTAAGLRLLSGIGDYTSAAIASIAFGEATAAVDGNVERVILRLTSNGKEIRSIRQAAEQLLDRERAGDFNQAMMELGATVCLPKNPLCLHCPVQKLCRTRGEHPTTPRKQMVNKAVSYAIVRRLRRGEPEVLLEQRPAEASLMAGMWELPQLENPEPESDRVLLQLRHSITVTNYQVSILHFEPQESRLLPKRGVKARKWVKAEELHNLPLTGIARKALTRLHVLPAAPPIRKRAESATFL